MLKKLNNILFGIKSPSLSIFNPEISAIFSIVNRVIGTLLVFLFIYIINILNFIDLLSTTHILKYLNNTYFISVYYYMFIFIFYFIIMYHIAYSRLKLSLFYNYIYFLINNNMTIVSNILKLFIIYLIYIIIILLFLYYFYAYYLLNQSVNYFYIVENYLYNKNNLIFKNYNFSIHFTDNYKYEQIFRADEFFNLYREYSHKCFRKFNYLYFNYMPQSLLLFPTKFTKFYMNYYDIFHTTNIKFFFKNINNSVHIFFIFGFKLFLFFLLLKIKFLYFIKVRNFIISNNSSYEKILFFLFILKKGIKKLDFEIGPPVQKGYGGYMIRGLKLKQILGNRAHERI